MEGLQLRYFVLKPKGNDIYAEASRQAILKYAEIIERHNPFLSSDLKKWLDKIELFLEVDEISKGGFRNYERKNTAELRPYLLGEDLSGISVSEVDDPKNDMGMIARNPENHKDQWYVAKKYFEENFKEVKNIENEN